MNQIWVIVGAIAVVFGGLAIAGLLDPAIAVFGFAALAGFVTVVLRRADGAGEVKVVEAAGPAPDATGGLKQVVSTLPDPAIALDADGHVVLCNDLAVAMLDALREGQHISSVIRAPTVLDALEGVAKSGETTRVDYEQRVPLERRFEVYIAPLPVPPEAADAKHEPSLLMMLRDLTQQERVERMRADFVAYASHELRTPLAAVLGFIETLQGAARNDAKAREQFLELMRTQATRMTRLIDDLLSLSRIELNAHVRPDSMVDLEPAVGHVLEYLAPLARDGGIDIETDFRIPGVQVMGDRDELVQVFQNLVENAMKYGQSGKRVEVTVEPGPTSPEGDEFIDLKVRDFGPGISPEHLPRLTERFYRVDVGESRAKGGTGLGLAIVKHIVNRHRGRLIIESAPGEGSTFTIRLPRVDSEAGQVRSVAS